MNERSVPAQKVDTHIDRTVDRNVDSRNVDTRVERHVDYNERNSTPYPNATASTRVSWGAILAGSAIALAVVFMLSLLAIGIGSAVIDPAQDANPLGGVGVGSGIFLIGAQLIALAIGGYVAAKLAGNPIGINSALHGAAVWALATFGMLFLATTAFSGLMGGVSTLVSKAGSGATSAVQAAVPENLGIGSIDMSSLPQSMQSTMREKNITPEDLQKNVQGVFKDTINTEERQKAMSEMQSTASAIASNPGSATQEIDKLINNLFGANGGVLSSEDRDQAVTSLSERLDISKQEAEQTIDQAQTQVEQSAKDVRAAANTAVEETTVAAQKTSEAVSKAALAGFAASLLGLIVAMVCGFFGRQKEVTA